MIKVYPNIVKNISFVFADNLV